jgi:hypothetical protein
MGTSFTGRLARQAALKPVANHRWRLLALALSPIGATTYLYHIREVSSGKQGEL